MYLGVKTKGRINLNLLFKVTSNVCIKENIIFISLYGGIFPISVIIMSPLILVDIVLSSSAFTTVEPVFLENKKSSLIFCLGPIEPFIFLLSISTSIPSNTWQSPIGNLNDVSKYSL